MVPPRSVKIPISSVSMVTFHVSSVNILKRCLFFMEHAPRVRAEFWINERRSMIVFYYNLRCLSFYFMINNFLFNSAVGYPPDSSYGCIHDEAYSWVNKSDWNRNKINNYRQFSFLVFTNRFCQCGIFAMKCNQLLR